MRNITDNSLPVTVDVLGPDAAASAFFFLAFCNVTNASIITF